MTSHLVTPLFVPGDRPERFAKAAASGATSIVIDLEDAVAPARKDEARSHVVAALRAQRTAFTIVRINSLQTREAIDDLLALRDEAPDAVMLPKVESSGEVRVAAASLHGVPLIALIESFDGVDRLRDIAREPSIVALAFGGYDLSAQLGSLPHDDVLAPYRSRVVFEAHAAEKLALDVPYLDIEDLEGLRAESLRALAWGFDGKLVIHPRHVAGVRSAFAPSGDELERARSIVAGGAAGGVLRIDGKMVDPPILASARRVLARATLVSKEA